MFTALVPYTLVNLRVCFWSTTGVTTTGVITTGRTTTGGTTTGVREIRIHCM